jgi:hypothetical protein
MANKFAANNEFKVGDKVVLYGHKLATITGFDSVGDIEVTYEDGEKDFHYRRYAVHSDVFNSPLYQALREDEN